MGTVAAGLMASASSRAQVATAPTREVSVLEYGAVPDGDAPSPTNNGPAFAAAIAALVSAGGGVLHVPPGTYYVAQSIQINSANISIEGAGSHLSILYFPATTGHGLIFSLPGSGGGETYQSVRVRDICLLTENTLVGGSNSDPGRCAIRYVPSGPQQGSPYLTVLIQDVEIRGRNGFVQFWDTGIYLNNAVNAWIESVEILGQFNRQAMFQGVLTDHYAINVTCSNCQVNYGNYGFRMYSNEPNTLPPGTQVAGTEGLQVINCGVGGCRTGAFHDNGTNPEARPALQVVGCNFNCTYNAVATSNVTECVVTGNIFYLQSTAFVEIEPGAACVNINPAGVNPPPAIHRHVISGNIFRALASPAFPARGVVCGGQFVAICGNTFDSFDLGIILTPTSANCHLSGNVFSSVTNFQVQNAGIENSFTAASPLESGKSVNII
jgi:hypothetical protein